MTNQTTNEVYALSVAPVWLSKTIYASALVLALVSILLLTGASTAFYGLCIFGVLHAVLVGLHMHLGGVMYYTVMEVENECE